MFWIQQGGNNYHAIPFKLRRHSHIFWTSHFGSSTGGSGGSSFGGGSVDFGSGGGFGGSW